MLSAETINYWINWWLCSYKEEQKHALIFGWYGDVIYKKTQKELDPTEELSEDDEMMVHYRKNDSTTFFLKLFFE